MSDPVSDFLLQNGFDSKQSHGAQRMVTCLFRHFQMFVPNVSKRFARQMLRPIRDEIRESGCLTKDRFISIVFTNFEHPKKWDVGYISFCRSKDFYSSQAWKNLRIKALAKGNYCRACGRKPDKIVLHVDHILPRSIYPELALELSNLQILCADCNLGKSNTLAKKFN